MISDRPRPVLSQQPGGTKNLTSSPQGIKALFRAALQFITRYAPAPGPKPARRRTEDNDLTL
jgi:hypothetical protein